MAFFNTKKLTIIPPPIPDVPPYIPPVIPTPESGSTPNIPRPTFSGNVVFKLYRCFDDNRTLNKNLTDMLSFDILLKNDTDILNPVIILESNNDLSSYNYSHIDVTNRYYYVSSVEYLGGNKFRLNLMVDVLMSYKDGIKGMTGILVKTDDIRYINEDFDDGSFVNQDGCAIAVKLFDRQPFLKTPTQVLIVSG